MQPYGTEPVTVEDLTQDYVKAKRIGLRRMLWGLPMPMSFAEVAESFGLGSYKLTKDAMAETKHHVQCYIPLPPRDLISLIISHHPAVFADYRVRDTFTKLAQQLVTLARVGSNLAFADVQDDYAPFSPDHRSGAHYTEAEKTNSFARFKAHLSVTLEANGFHPLSKDIIDRAQTTKSAHGVTIRQAPEGTFEHLMYFRGEGSELQDFRTLFGGCYSSKQPRQMPTLSNVVVIFRPLVDKKKKKGYEHLQPFKWYLKLYRDVVEADVDMLLPNCKIVLSVLDWLNLVVPTMIGLGTSIYHLVTYTAIDLSNTNAIITAALLVIAPFTYLLGAILSIRNKQVYYSNQMYNSLFIKAQASNAATLSTLVQEAAAQEAMEAVLCFFFLWRGLLAPAPMDTRTLDAEIERFLNAPSVVAAAAVARIDFQVHDGTEKLRQMGLLSSSESLLGGIPVVQVLPLDAALDKVLKWDALKRLYSRRDAAVLHYHEHLHEGGGQAARGSAAYR